MARLAIKIQRYFRRRPLRLFTFFLVYLMAGSLVFLHPGFVGDSPVAGRSPRLGEGGAHAGGSGGPPPGGGGNGNGLQRFSFLPFGRAYKEGPDKEQWSGEVAAAPRRYGPPWMKPAPLTDSVDKLRAGEHVGSWSRALKGKMSRDQEENRAKYIGCYLDSNKQRALRGTAFFDYRKMTIFRCQDNCAERGYQYAGLEFGAECYCGHRIQTTNTSDAECSMECKGQKTSTCGGPNRLSVYRLELARESARRYDHCLHGGGVLSVKPRQTVIGKSGSVKPPRRCTLSTVSSPGPRRKPLRSAGDGSALFRGCFKRPDNVSLALHATTVLLNMSVDRCVDHCTEKEYTLAVLGGGTCRCGFPTMHFTLHEPEDEHLCAYKCPGEEYEQCGSAEYYMVYQTQVQDNRCLDRRFLPVRSKRLVALASFPGAGNTWGRHLMELTTGYYTGSYYFDGSLYNKGFKGERDHWKSGRLLCIKTHESGKTEIESFDAAILLIRNPYKALMAEFNRKYGGHIGFASEAHWKGREWPEFVRNYAPWWASHTLDWLRYGRRVLVVHYEDLKHDLFNQLKKMVAALGLAISDDRLLCVESQKDGNFKRSGLRKLEYDPYTAEMRRVIGVLVKTVDVALKLRNLTGVPEDYAPR